MKELQNNYTTPEQSKRLLELGVPMNSADCIRVIDTNVVFVLPNGRNIEYYIDKYNDERNTKAGPCWSVGRLLEIYLTCALEYHPYDDFYTETPSLHLMAFDKDRLIEEVIEIMSEDKMNFSKLEE